MVNTRRFSEIAQIIPLMTHEKLIRNPTILHPYGFIEIFTNVGKTITHHLFGNGLYMDIPPIYGDLGDGLSLFYRKTRINHPPNHHSFIHITISTHYCC